MLPIPSPIGPLWVRTAIQTSGKSAVVGLSWQAGLELPELALFTAVEAWLADYFQGRFRPVSFPMAPVGTPFQQSVWRLLTTIPPGATLCYGQAARLLNSGARPVGGAAGRNPIPLLIPCHRLIGARGALGGYSGEGGGATKQWLLQHEAKVNA